MLVVTFPDGFSIMIMLLLFFCDFRPQGRLNVILMDLTRVPLMIALYE
jgi:hypothetical protein